MCSKKSKRIVQLYNMIAHSWLNKLNCTFIRQFIIDNTNK